MWGQKTKLSLQIFLWWTIIKRFLHLVLWLGISHHHFPFSSPQNTRLAWLNPERSSQYEEPLTGLHLKVTQWRSQYLLHFQVHCSVTFCPELQGHHRSRCTLSGMLFCINQKATFITFPARLCLSPLGSFENNFIKCWLKEFIIF